MNVDLTPLVQALAALALAAVTAITPFLSLLLRRYLHVRLTAAEAAAVQSAADAGAKAAYGYIAVHNASYRDVAIRERDVAIRETAIAKGVQHVAASAPEALTDLGITPEHVRSMVEARFGGLLATDPSVSINAHPTP
jgi:hypothetical protein